MKYILFDKAIITLDEDNIVREITNITNTKNYKRIGNKQRTYICGQPIPSSFNGYYYDTIEILKKANNLYDYSKDADTCGVYTSYYYNGMLKEEYFHINSIKNGIYKSYYENGILEIECEYIDNKLNGFYKKYDDKNNLLIECSYKDDKLHGIFKKYQQNCYNDTTLIPRYCEKYISSDKIIYSETPYIDGIINGDYICKFNNYICTSMIQNGIIVNIQLKNINTNRIIYKSNQIEHENNIYKYKNESFYDSGELYELSYKINFEKFDGEYTNYYKNGNICEFKKYENNKIIHIKSYYENENIKETKDKQKFEDIKDSEKKIYIHKVFYENGNLKEEKIYNDANILLSSISYHKNTKINTKCSYNNIYNSIPLCIETYNEDGILTHYKDYSNGCVLEYNNKKLCDKNIIGDKEKLQKFAQALLDSIKD